MKSFRQASAENKERALLSCKETLPAGLTACATGNVFLVIRIIIAATDSSSRVFGKHYKSDADKVMWEGTWCPGEAERSGVEGKPLIKPGPGSLTSLIWKDRLIARLRTSRLSFSGTWRRFEFSSLWRVSSCRSELVSVPGNVSLKYFCF